MDGEDFVLHREMGCTREDFIRWLPGATRDPDLRVEADRTAMRVDGGRVEIAFAPGPERTVGLVSLPVLKVTFRFLNVGPAARSEFMAYFDLYTKRGGG